MTIKVISFDIGGTLVKQNCENQHYSLKELPKIVKLPADEVITAYKNIFQKKREVSLL